MIFFSPASVKMSKDGFDQAINVSEPLYLFIIFNLDVHMQKLKNNDSDTGSDMKCQDLDLCDSSDKSNTEVRNKKKKDLRKSSTPSLKRRKSSFNSCDGATGGHELDTVKVLRNASTV